MDKEHKAEVHSLNKGKVTGKKIEEKKREDKKTIEKKEEKSSKTAEDKTNVTTVLGSNILETTVQTIPREHRSELEEQLREESKENIELLRAGSIPEKPVNPEYALQLSQKPIDKIYHEMTSLYQLAGEKGYLNSEEQRRVQYLVSAVEKKVQAAEEHRYDMTEEAASVAGITRQIGAKLKDFYKGNREYQVEYRFS